LEDYVLPETLLDEVPDTFIDVLPDTVHECEPTLLDEEGSIFSPDELLDLWQHGPPAATAKSEPAAPSTPTGSAVPLAEPALAASSSTPTGSAAPTPTALFHRVRVRDAPAASAFSASAAASAPRDDASPKELPIAVFINFGDILDWDDQLELNEILKNDGKEALVALIEESDWLHGVEALATQASSIKRIPQSLLVSPDKVNARFLPQPGARAGARIYNLEVSLGRVLDERDGWFWKVGYAANPLWRFNVYQCEGRGWEYMFLLDVDFDVEKIQLLESFAIRLSGHRAGCQNMVSGGEGPRKTVQAGTPAFLYVVLGDAAGPLWGRKRQRLS